MISAPARVFCAIIAVWAAACGGAPGAVPAGAPPEAKAAPAVRDPDPPPAHTAAPADVAPDPLEAACFAQPWASTSPQTAPKTLSPATSERLDVLKKECRDVHPELGPARFATPEAIPVDECHYGIARIYLEERHYAEAARRFRRTAVEHADSDISVFAAQFYLQTLWAEGAPRSAECRALFTQDAQRFICKYCEPSGPAEECSNLRAISRETGALRCAARRPSSSLRTVPFAKRGAERL